MKYLLEHHCKPSVGGYDDEGEGEGEKNIHTFTDQCIGTFVGLRIIGAESSTKMAYVCVIVSHILVFHPQFDLTLPSNELTRRTAFTLYSRRGQPLKAKSSVDFWIAAT